MVELGHHPQSVGLRQPAECEAVAHGPTIKRAGIQQTRTAVMNVPTYTSVCIHMIINYLTSTMGYMDISQLCSNFQFIWNDDPAPESMCL